MPLGASRFGLLGGVADLGKLELIETQTVTSAVAQVDFTSIDENTYNVHFLTINNFRPATDNATLFMRFYESGVLETASVYQYAYQYGSATNNFSDRKSTGISYLRASDPVGHFGSERGHSYSYLYNLGDSAKYSFQTLHNVFMNKTPDTFFMFGSGVLPQTSTVDGIRLVPSSGDITELTASLYGIAES
tara:strand:- start:769 stop:1338 length:570 start_codon:yes stop_codon:yes gene_type:complete